MKLTARQEQAQAVLAGPATHLMLYGGSRSGKTFLLTRNVVMRALKAPGSRHAIVRFRFNAVKASVVLDTFPKVMELAFPGVKADLSKSDWFARLTNKSEIWFAGLDDKERTEKILGQEYATIMLNEVSQIPWNSRNMAVTRLAQRVMQKIDGQPETELPLRMYYDCNPPSKAHWTYKRFIKKVDPETGKPLENPGDYASFQINPGDNAANLSSNYMSTLQALPEPLRSQMLYGEGGSTNSRSAAEYQGYTGSFCGAAAASELMSLAPVDRKSVV